MGNFFFTYFKRKGIKTVSYIKVRLFPTKSTNHQFLYEAAVAVINIPRLKSAKFIITV